MIKKTKRLEIVLTPEQARAFATKAKQAGMGVGTWLRAAGLMLIAAESKENRHQSDKAA